MFYFILNPFDYIIITIEKKKKKSLNIYTINVPFLLIIYRLLKNATFRVGYIDRSLWNERNAEHF